MHVQLLPAVLCAQEDQSLQVSLAPAVAEALGHCVPLAALVEAVAAALAGSSTSEQAAGGLEHSNSQEEALLAVSSAVGLPLACHLSKVCHNRVL